jgi:acylpyruvate hydrolase
MNFEASVTRTLPKIIGVDKNYVKHIIEMGEKDIPQTPVIFLKPWTSLSYAPKQLKLSNPAHKHLIHHEIELGVVIGKSGSHIPK